MVIVHSQRLTYGQMAAVEKRSTRTMRSQSTGAGSGIFVSCPDPFSLSSNHFGFPLLAFFTSWNRIHCNLEGLRTTYFVYVWQVSPAACPQS